MKRLLYILLFPLFVVGGCDSEDNYDGEKIQIFPEPEFDFSTGYGKKQVEFYEKYGIVIIDKLDINFYTFNWTSIQPVVEDETTKGSHNVTAADTAYILDVSDYIEKEIIGRLGDDFVKAYFPRYIQLMNMCGTNTTSGLLEGMEAKARMYPGWGNIAVNYVALAGVSERFEEMKGNNELQRKWLSLFFEKAYDALPFSYEFSELYEEGYKKDNYSDMTLSKYNDYGFIQSPRTSAYLLGVHSPSRYVSKLVIKQDFGDFAAAVMVCPEEELNEMKAINSVISRKIEVMRNYLVLLFAGKK